ncbi:hypothetical protein BC830DRAFT_480151 [Chytriomyces sp. MP71]|nr:hypothetical protein BC830DRAFT_480151 [Chytriomyces sp. MP71]
MSRMSGMPRYAILHLILFLPEERASPSLPFLSTTFIQGSIHSCTICAASPSSLNSNVVADSVNNSKNNETLAHYESLCCHYAWKHACPNAVEILADWLDNNQDSLPAKSGKGATILDTVEVII